MPTDLDDRLKGILPADESAVPTGHLYGSVTTTKGEIKSVEVWQKTEKGSDPLVARFTGPFLDAAAWFIPSHNRALSCNSPSSPVDPAAPSAPSTPSSHPAATSASPPPATTRLEDYLADQPPAEPATYDRPSFNQSLEGLQNPPTRE